MARRMHSFPSKQAVPDRDRQPLDMFERKPIMKSKMFVVAVCLGLLMVVFQPASADQWDKKTILTLNEPMQVAKTTLQPGKYVMKLMDSPSNRHIVQIFNEDQSQLITTVLALPNYRLSPKGETELKFEESAVGTPRPLKEWFYPGDNFGQEFISPVQAVQVTQTAAVTTAPEPAVAETKEEVVIAQATPPPAPEPEPAPAPEVTPAPEPQPEPAPAVQAEPAPAPVQEEAPRQLPETGSPVPLIGLLGFASMGLSFGVRALAKRS
jgi:hypothetical protein